MSPKSSQKRKKSSRIRGGGFRKAGSSSFSSVVELVMSAALLLLLLLASGQWSAATSGAVASSRRERHSMLFAEPNGADSDDGESAESSSGVWQQGQQFDDKQSSLAPEAASLSSASVGGAPGTPLTNAWNRVVIGGSLLIDQQQQPLSLVATMMPPPGQSNSVAANSRAYNVNLMRNDSQQQQQQRAAIRLATTSRNSANSNMNDENSDKTLATTPNPNLNNAGHEITKILQSFFNGTNNYDKRIRPNYSGEAAVVNVSFHIIGISSVSEVQMDFTTDFYFRQKWNDPRLKFTPVGTVGGKNITELSVGAGFAEKIWLPDTFFANEKTANFHKATTENTFIRVGYGGSVYRSIRLTVTLSCRMDLQFFPMDRQKCNIEIESYGYNTNDIDYKWESKHENESVSMDGKIELPQFKIEGFKLGKNYSDLATGKYVRLFCEIHFARSMGYYLIQIYIPASLIVIISWVSFWLHRNATPARVALGVTTVLTMTTLMSSTNAALPKISYIKSIDVFLGTCFVMVFASLLEYASVGYIGKRIAMKRKRQHELKQMQLHHQKVCVAAAASAAAAAHAAQKTNPAGVAHAFVKASQLILASGDNNNKANSLSRRKFDEQQQPTSLRRIKNNASAAAGDDNFPPAPPLSNGQRSTIKIMPEPQRYLSSELIGPPGASAKQQPASLLAIQAPPPPPPQAPSGQPQAEFETTAGNKQAAGEEIVRICGLTPSAIDKYSRVVFPICFVCFNLMYWIIYGHISATKEDDGRPLIPFIRT